MDPDDGLSFFPHLRHRQRTDANQKGANLGGNERRVLRVAIYQSEANGSAKRVISLFCSIDMSKTKSTYYQGTKLILKTFVLLLLVDFKNCAPWLI